MGRMGLFFWDVILEIVCLEEQVCFFFFTQRISTSKNGGIHQRFLSLSENWDFTTRPTKWWRWQTHVSHLPRNMCILEPFYFKWGSFQPETVMDINMKGGDFDPQTKEEIGNSFGKDKSITNGKVSEHFLMFWYVCFFLHILFSILSYFSLPVSWVPFFWMFHVDPCVEQVEKQGSENLAQLEVGGVLVQIHKKASAENSWCEPKSHIGHLGIDILWHT